jgi:alpha-2-macroglobulin
MRAAAVAVVVAAAGLTAAPPPLRVLRVSPTETAEPTAAITVTFDRPVAGQLDGTVDPARLITIAPAVAGRAEWRDPITLVFAPAAPLATTTTYTVTIANTFTAMDGGRLAEPYRFSFRVGGPAVLDGSPVARYSSPRFLTPNAEFEILVSVPADLPTVSRLVHIALDERCGMPAVVPVTAVSQRPVGTNDPSRYQYAGGYRRDRRHDVLRRVVRLVPARPLPAGCSAALVIPPNLDLANTAPVQRWSFATYGPLTFDRVTCDNEPMCPAGFLRVTFSNPVKGADVLRAVRLAPAARFTVSDTSELETSWVLEGVLRTRTTYTVTVDSSLTDAFGQRLTGIRTRQLATTGYASSLDYPAGIMLVERESFRTLAVRHVNVDSLAVTVTAVPESALATVLAAPRWNLDDAVANLTGGVTRTMSVRNDADVPFVSAVRVPAYNAARPEAPVLSLIRIERRSRAAPGMAATTDTRRRGGIALVQVTNLGVAARLGDDEALVWVTTLNDGLPKPGANVVLHGPRGQVRARGTTDAQGLARFTSLPGIRDTAAESGGDGGFEGYALVTSGSDRALVSFDSYNWELSPWRFNVPAAWGAERLPAAGAVFTERGIYRPGETVFAKAIVRTGHLGALRAPARGDSVKWTFFDRVDGRLRDTVVTLSAFGTADQRLPLAADMALGTYRVGISIKRRGEWVELGSTSFRVAEYRPPEFLVTLTADSGGRAAGDSLRAAIEARYLFGAPMANATVQWSARRTPLWPWEIQIPGMEQYEVGESGWWWEEYDDGESSPRSEVITTATDTLDGAGRLSVRVALGAPARGRPARVTVQATVTDVNRQNVTASTSTTLHPASFYVGARSLNDEYFWRAGRAESVAVLAVRPDGRRVEGVAVRGTLVRREWHRVMRGREGLDEIVGSWVSDTVATCDVTTGAAPQMCRFTPAQGGSYILTFRARDDRGRTAVTSFYRWATGRGWVPWYDANQFKMDVIPDRTRYDVGDTATVLFASPFTDAEALVTIEREGVIEHRRLRITSGATSMRLPLTETHVPNVFVSIVVMRGRSAPPGGIADAGRPALRVGYAQLRVTPALKRLSVDVRPQQDEYRPGDSARVRVRVRDARGAGRRSEVTLWAVDEGVLSLTGYTTPDLIDLIYQPRGVSLRVGSNLTDVAAQVADSGVSLKGDHAPGGGGGLEGGDILRSRFSSTAFFLGSVITDSAGEAVAAARLPDNLTTFRVMAVAVTPGDRFGSGQSSVLVTRPLLARPALPRFLRRDDRTVAGVVVNRRSGTTAPVRVRATVRGATLGDAALKTTTLARGRGAEVRFAFRDTASDTAAFRFDVGDGRDSDAVLIRLPIRPGHTPRAHTTSGSVRLTTPVELTLPGDIDPVRSRLVFSAGTTPLAVVEGMYRNLALYPYECTEQLADEMLTLISLVRLAALPGARPAPRNAREEIARGVAVMTRRQRPDGGIGLWSAGSWTTPWLSAYAGEILLAARAIGVPVSDSLISKLAEYLYVSVHQKPVIEAPLGWWFVDTRARLSEDVAAVDFLSRAGRTDMSGENELLRLAPQMAWEDRVRLAGVIARRGAGDAARRLLAPIWAAVRVEGRRAVLPDSAQRDFYFWSRERPAARLLQATLAVDSSHALIGPLVETIVERARTARGWWNTQDFGAAAAALADFTLRQQRAARRGFALAGGQRILFRTEGPETAREFERNLVGLLTRASDGTNRLALTVTAQAGESPAPLYFFVTVHEVPLRRPVTPDDRGITVERWYEDYETGRPVTSVVEGSLVRVRLRIRTTVDRHFVALTDPLPAGLEALDLSLRTTGLPGPGAWRNPAAYSDEEEVEGEAREPESGGWRAGWYYGWWDGGWWSPFDHREMRDDRVGYVATYLWPGTYSATYVARATTPGVYVRPPAHAEEMYNPAVQGRSDGGVFTVTRRTAR